MNKNSAPITIVAFGDSITAAAEVPHEKRWLTLVGARLRRLYPGRPFKLINAGVGGETSREAFARLDKDVLQHRPRIVIIGFGANDATREQARHVPCAEFLRNLAAMVAPIQSLPARVLLLNIVPVVDQWHCWRADPFFRDNGGLQKCLDSYRASLREFAADRGILLANIDAALQEVVKDHGPETVTLPDGVHLTEVGNETVAAEVCNNLARILCEIETNEEWAEPGPHGR